MSQTRVAYIGTALPANADTENIFSTQVSASSGFFQHAGIKRFLVSVKNDQAGTLKEYRSVDGGATWDQISQTSVALVASTARNTYDFLVEPYEDWKLDWVNGGVTQTTFDIDLALETDRALAM